MGTDNELRITFANLDDVKTMISVLIGGFEATVKAAGMLARMGTPANSPESMQARQAGRDYAKLLIATYEEFNRLHVDCGCPMTEDDVTRAIAQLREILTDIDRDDEMAANTPPYVNKENPLAALFNRLSDESGGGMQVAKIGSAEDVKAFFESLGGAESPETREGKFGTDGTGMYL